jgi:2-polyprenyl-3-methyl-5-hydroxy-6-metoxy-1,4-benzoquinol methylase
MEKCPNCEARRFTTVYTGREYSLLRCNQCGLVVKHVEGLTAQAVQGLQDQVYYDTGRLQLPVTFRVASERLELLRQFASGGRLLEIGCATGEFLDFARHAGFDVMGVDASRTYCDCATARGLDVRLGRLEDLDLAPGSLDVVAMFHLIEHLQNPADTLSRVHDLLAPGGKVIIVTPNLEAATDRMFGFSRPNFHQPDHLLFFSPETLGQLLTRCGFQAELVTTREHLHTVLTILSGWLVRVLRQRLVRKPASTAHAARTAPSPAPAPSGGVMLACKGLLRRLPYAISALLYPILKPYSLLAENRLKGHELIVIARKPTGQDALPAAGLPGGKVVGVDK